MPLLEVRHLSKTFPVEGGVFRRRVGSVQALQDVSFQIEPGETLALVGGSGCGKSTLAKILVGWLSPDAGTLLWNGQLLDTQSRRQRAHLMQMIFQDPYASLNPKLSIETQLAEAVRLTEPDLAAAGIHRRCIELLEAVRLPGDTLNHYPFQFSGGQRQRIAIARALAMRPTLLIADEPLSALDVSVQAQILDLFRNLKEALGLTMLFITHDLAVAANSADRIVVLQEGRLVEEGVLRDVLRQPRHTYTQALLKAVPSFPC
ncbi:MAG: ATP-binding cassette domain-containing protein [Elusimicrobiota bacterium]|jgi:ABC-type glutathione transport system ATPase component